MTCLVSSFCHSHHILHDFISHKNTNFLELWPSAELNETVENLYTLKVTLMVALYSNIVKIRLNSGVV